MLGSVLRRKWLILLATVAGTGAGILMGERASPLYEAQSTLWIEKPAPTNQGPIQTERLLSSSAWLDLLRSFVVLDYVVSAEKLFIQSNEPGAFSTFQLREGFQPGSYRLEVSEDGGSFTLSSDRNTVQRGKVGESVGTQLGFDWTPDHSILQPRRILDFAVVDPREVSVRLSQDLGSFLNVEGNFLRLTLAGADPARITETLNTLTARYVDVAAQLKRDKLDQLTKVLEEQRRQAEDNLREAEVALESFRVRTITVSPGKSTPAAGVRGADDPSVTRFFELEAERDELHSERTTIARILSEASGSVLSLDALLMVPAVQKAPALSSALNDRVAKRAELDVLLQRFTPEHASSRELADGIQQLEEVTIPVLANELMTQLSEREAELDARIGSSSTELQQIPPLLIQEARLQRGVTNAESLHTGLKQRYEEARLAAASTVPDIRVLDTASVPSRPIRDPGQFLVLIGLLAGLGLSVVGVVTVDRLDSHVRYPEEVTYGMGLQILSVVPKVIRSRRGENDPTTHVEEAFRELRMSLIHAAGSARPIAITISSPGSGDGKSFVASNLALTFAVQGLRTLIIDGDVRRGQLHRTLDAQRTPGLTDWLAGNVDEAQILQATRFPNVYLIGTGTQMAEAPELLSSPAMSQLLTSLRAQFDVILVDSPPLGAGIDAYALGSMTRDMIVVLRTGSTERAYAAAKLSVLDRLPIRVVGAVLNGAPPNDSAYRQYSYLPGYSVATTSASSRLPVG
jgi:polysaccharide biosynthesis transport protein